MTAKQKLLELIEELPEEAAERLLQVAKREAATPTSPKGNLSALLLTMRQWEQEDADLPRERLAEIRAVILNPEPTHCPLPEEP